MTTPPKSDEKAQPQTCEHCAAPIPNQTGTLALCDECYIASTNTCCSDS